MDKIKRVTIEKELIDPYYLKDPKLLELYKKSLPPKEAYYYFPKGEEIIVLNNEKPIKSIRRVFYKMPYTNDEKQWLSEFKQILSSHSELKLPDYFDDYLLLCFIYSTGGNLNDSYNRLIEYLEYYKKNFPITITPQSKLIEILNKGFIYVYGRDNRYRPIIVCQCKVFQKLYKNYSTEELLQASAFLCQFMANNMLIPGHFETWNMIINLTGVSIISLPEPLKRMIPELSNYFLCRLYKNYIIGLTFITRIIYKIACNFLDKVTVSKLIVLDKKKDPILFTEIRKDNIEEQFGGTAPNLPQDSEHGFFPPRMPSEEFIKENENKNEILITEDEYISKYKNGEIPEECISPYIIDKLKLDEKKNNESNYKSEPIHEAKSEVISKGKISSYNKINMNKSNIKIEQKRYSTINKQESKVESLLLKKQNEMATIRHILYHGWTFDNELPTYKYDCNSPILNSVNFLNEINKLGKKRQKFICNISSFNGKNKYVNNYS